MQFGCFTVRWQLNTCKIEFQATETFSRHLPYLTSIMNLEIWLQVPLYCTFQSRETAGCIYGPQVNYWNNDSSIPCSLWGTSLRVKMSHSSSLLASARSVICEGSSKSPQGFEFIQSGLETAFSRHMKCEKPEPLWEGKEVMLQFICTVLTKQLWFTKIYKDAWVMIGLSWLLSYLWYISPRFQPPHQLFFFFFTFSCPFF